jgi:hypothetical protein
MHLRELNSRPPGLKGHCQMRHLVSSFNIRLGVPLHDNEDINVNRTLFPPSNTDILIDDLQYNTNVSVPQHRGDL